VTDDGRIDFTFYVTAEERVLLQEAANRAGLPLETWIIRSVDRVIRRNQIAQRVGMEARRGWWPGLVDDLDDEQEDV
jgi:hypothetical protein